MSKYWSKLRCLKGGGSLWAQISREGGRPPTTLGVRKSLWAITWCCLRDHTFSRFDTIPACDRQTDTHTDTRRRLIPYPCIASAARVKRYTVKCKILWSYVLATAKVDDRPWGILSWLAFQWTYAFPTVINLSYGILKTCL